MSSKGSMSRRTLINWLLVATLSISGVVTSLSGLYFLLLPSGGYQGGRNPMYGVTILFGRSSWSDLHTWAGVLMVAAALVHLVMHRKWVSSMVHRMARELAGRCKPMNWRGRLNLIVNAMVAASYLIVALSGVYFLFVPAHGGGRSGSISDPMFLFGRATWDTLHTWAGVLMITVAVAHFVIHWRWVVKTTGALARSIRWRPAPHLRETWSAVR